MGYALWHDPRGLCGWWPAARAGLGLLLRPHPISVLGARKRTRAHVLGIARDGGLDAGSEIAVALDEFGHSRREPEHVLEHQDLAIAGGARADADGRDRDLLGDTAPERLGHGLNHHRE